MAGEALELELPNESGLTKKEREALISKFGSDKVNHAALEGSASRTTYDIALRFASDAVKGNYAYTLGQNGFDSGRKIGISLYRRRIVPNAREIPREDSVKSIIGSAMLAAGTAAGFLLLQRLIRRS